MNDKGFNNKVNAAERENRFCRRMSDRGLRIRYHGKGVYEIARVFEAEIKREDMTAEDWASLEERALKALGVE